MKWNERLAQARKASGLSQTQAAEAMGRYLEDGDSVSLSAVSSWEQGRSQPKAQYALAMAALLNADPFYLFGTDNMGDGLNDAGLAKLDEYRRLLLDSPRFRAVPAVTAVRVLPVYLQAASAGTGQWLDGSEAENVEVDDSVPHSAEFGVRLAGDSMEPRFTNGQIVWAKRRETADNGDIVLCYLNGQSYCKKLWQDEGGVRLNSINRAYQPILITPEDDFRVFGVVVG